ncbi:MAG: DNA repair protein RecN [Actinobacteria bacterium]|nr:DNA repair protein RecN [Actinomycetota bacterium]
MLEEINIHNYALIDKLALKFGNGLNLLTGETGAGKSILLGALGILLGKKSDISVIRTGTMEAMVSGTINISNNSEAEKWLLDHGIAPEEGTIIIRRVIKQTGRGGIYIQSTPVTRAELVELSSFLFDIHGQHDHQSLLSVENQRNLLDRFGNTESLASGFSKLFFDLAAAREKYTKLLSSEKQRLREIDFLKHAILEIKEAQLKEGEEEKLEREYRILFNHERLFNLIENIYSNTSETKGGVLSALRNIRENMEEVIQINPELSRLINQLQDAFYEIEDFSESIRHYKDSIEYNPQRLIECEERLKLTRTLQKKYGDTIEEVLDFCRKSEEELEVIQNWEEEKKNLQDCIALLEPDLKKIALQLSSKRKTAAQTLQERVERELKELGMPKVKFKVEVKERKNSEGKTVFTPSGIDTIDYLISPNLGEPYKPLNKIASGGEISRIMLSIKSVLSEADHITSLVFDEIDSGIGGEVAVSVGEKLKKLSANKQVLCITHLATIAVRADNHLKVEKLTSTGRTYTKAFPVTGQLKKEEISRMLSGDSKDQISLRHAEELLKKYG